MALARSQSQWDHTAALLTLLANIHRDPRRQRPFTLRDFHPEARPPAAAAPLVADLSVLKAVFIDRHLPEVACGTSWNASSPSSLERSR